MNGRWKAGKCPVCGCRIVNDYEYLYTPCNPWENKGEEVSVYECVCGANLEYCEGCGEYVEKGGKHDCAPEHNIMTPCPICNTYTVSADNYRCRTCGFKLHVPTPEGEFEKFDVLTIQVQVRRPSEMEPLLKSLHGEEWVAGCQVMSIHKRDMPVCLMEVEDKLKEVLALVRNDVMDVTWRLLQKNRRGAEQAGGGLLRAALEYKRNSDEKKEEEDV